MMEDAGDELGGQSDQLTPLLVETKHDGEHKTGSSKKASKMWTKLKYATAAGAALRRNVVDPSQYDQLSSALEEQAAGMAPPWSTEPRITARRGSSASEGRGSSTPRFKNVLAAARASKDYKAQQLNVTIDHLTGPELEHHATDIDHGDFKWPFLLRFKVTTFGISMGVCAQSLVFESFVISPKIQTPEWILWVWWIAGICLLALFSAIYACKIWYYMGAVQREWSHPIRRNFFVAPLLCATFLQIGAPSEYVNFVQANKGENVTVHIETAAVFGVVLLIYDVFVYRSWLLDQTNSIRSNNPTFQLAVVGNFLIGGMLGQAGAVEATIFFFAVGAVLWVVVFVTLFQDLSTAGNDGEWRIGHDGRAHPTLFLFIAPPSAASIAWATIIAEGPDVPGGFELGSRLMLFFALFMYLFLMVGWYDFLHARWTLTHWAVTFPMAAVSTSTQVYSIALGSGEDWSGYSGFIAGLSFVLGIVSTTAVIFLAMWTIMMVCNHKLFPPDPVMGHNLLPVDAPYTPNARALGLCGFPPGRMGLFVLYIYGCTGLISTTHQDRRDPLHSKHARCPRAAPSVAPGRGAQASRLAWI